MPHKKTKNCKDCNKKIDKRNTRCQVCNSKYKQKKSFKLTKEMSRFIRKNYEKTFLSQEQVRVLFNKKFHTKLKKFNFAKKMGQHQITKDKQYLLKIQQKHALKAQKAHKGTIHPRIYTLEIINEIRKLAKSNFSVNEIKNKIETKFQREFNIYTLKTLMSKNKISYHQYSICDIEHKEFLNSKKFIELILKYKNSPYYILRDKIIEKFHVNIYNKELRKIIKYITYQNYMKRQGDQETPFKPVKGIKSKKSKRTNVYDE